MEFCIEIIFCNLIDNVWILKQIRSRWIRQRRKSPTDHAAGLLRDIPSFNSLLQFHISTTITAKYSTSSKKKKEQKLWKIQLLNIQAEHDKSRQSGTRVGDYSWVANERKSWFSEETCNYDVNRYILMCLPWFFFLLKHDLLLFFVCALPKHTILNQSTPKTVFVCTITNWNKGKSWPIAIFFTAEFIKNYGSNSDCSI